MRILNIGCGNETYGTDFIDKYPQRAEVRECDIELNKLPYPNNTFEIIRSKFLLEHLLNRDNYMRETYRVLKVGGIHTIITDNANFIGFMFNEHGNHKGYFNKEDTHFSLFTEGHLRNMAKRYGFKTIRTYYLNTDASNNPLKLITKKIINIFTKKLTGQNVCIDMKKG